MAMCFDKNAPIVESKKLENPSVLCIDFREAELNKVQKLALKPFKEERKRRKLSIRNLISRQNLAAKNPRMEIYHKLDWVP